jgi:cyclase
MISNAQVFQDRNAHIADLVIPCVDVVGGHAATPARIPGLSDPEDVVQIVATYARDGASKIFVDVYDPWDQTQYLKSLLQRLAHTGLSVLVSVGHGHIPSADSVGELLDAGAAVVSVSTSLVEDPQSVLSAAHAYGAEHLLAVINCRRRPMGGWDVYTHNGTREAGIDALSLTRQLAGTGIGAVLPNAVDREGAGRGYDLELTRAVAEESGRPVIASGGCGNLEHLKAALSEGQATYVLVNSMVHNGRYTVADICDSLFTHSSFA